MRALVTGSAGFVGRHMVAELQRRGWDVTGADPRGWDRRDAVDVFGYDGNVYDLVVHAAAVAPHRAAIDGMPSSHVRNQLLDAAMFDWAIRTRQRRVLYLSSCAVLDEQPDDYGQLKLTGERMAAQARAAGLPVTVVRPFSGYGEDQGLHWPFGAFAARARGRADPFEVWGDGGQVRDWIHIDDVVCGALALADAGVNGPVSLCTGIGTSMDELALMMAAAVGYSPRLAHRVDRPGGQPRRVGDPTELLRVYQPTVTLEQGVKRALEVG